MDIGKSFTYMFEDQNWIAKLAIGGAIVLLGVLFSWVLAIPLIAAGALVLGYSLTVTKNVADGVALPLPEWNDLGALFVKGLTGLVGIIIWYLPLILVACCAALVNVALGNAAASSNGAAQNASGALTFLSLCLACIEAIVGIIVGVTLYAPLTRFALNGQLNTFWDFSGNFKFIQANISNYIIAVLLLLVANIIAGFGIIACVIGVFFTSFWANLVGAHLFGQVARGMPSIDMTPMAPLPPPPMETATPA